MYRFWDTIIEPLLEELQPKTLVEIGCAEGRNTRNLLAFCGRHDAKLHAVDPKPAFDVEEFQESSGGRLTVHRALSLNAIPDIGSCDAVLIDGDHNWYTVYNELLLIEKVCTEAGKPFPVAFIHDIGWPYGRRDLYYDPETIPEAYRKPYRKLGLKPGSKELLEEGGMNRNLCNSIYENNLQNGVLTAVEDFLKERTETLELAKLPGIFGLGILLRRELRQENKKVDRFLKSLSLAPAAQKYLERLEELRVMTEIDAAELVNQVNRQLTKVRSSAQSERENWQTREKELLHRLEILERQREEENRRQAEQLAKRQADLDQTLGKLQEKEQVLAESQAQMQSAQAQLKEVRERVATVIAESKRLEEERDTLNQQLVKLRSATESNHKRHQERETELLEGIEALEEKQEALRGSLADRETQLEERDRVLKNREQELVGIKRQLESRQQDVRLLSGMIEKLDFGITELLNSRRWKWGTALGDLRRRTFLKPKLPTVEALFSAIREDFRSWAVEQEESDDKSSTKIDVDIDENPIDGKKSTLRTESSSDSLVESPGSSGSVSSLLTQNAYSLWRSLPVSNEAKARFKDATFGTLPFLFRGTTAYNVWRESREIDLLINGDSFQDGTWDPPEIKYVPLLEASPLASKPVRLIAFYLPQFHPIPENDEWWGKGFTEWTNVRPAQPQFVGHHQPHVPGELGYYDLRDKEVQRRQIELARLYGLDGFCFYFYWFAGKRLLEKPVENWLEDKSLDFPFCLCWANENWSRRWDGLHNEILIAQQHSPEDDLAFIEEVAPFLRDRRYIRVQGKPLFLVYQPGLLPSAKDTSKRWRQWCREAGIGEIFLAYTQSLEKTDPSKYGFDAAVEFPPNLSGPPDITKAVTPLGEGFDATVYDWSIFPRRSESYQSVPYKLFRSVCPGWDNTPRRRNGAVFVNNTPDLYRKWLENAIADTIKSSEESSERLVFVNAWNEWAEGAHLEPDAANGYAYLQATRDALENAQGSANFRIVIVSHDAHPHGAQLNALHMAKGYGELGFEVDLIVLGEGELLSRFAEVATVHRIDPQKDDRQETLRRLRELNENGAKIALANTTVSGDLVPLLKEAGFYTVSLVHELPGILESYGLRGQATSIAQSADSVIFAAEIVRSGFEDFLGKPLTQATIRPQGSYMRIRFSTKERQRIRPSVRNRLGLPDEARIILCAGYGDRRKGLDLFVDGCMKVLEKDRLAAAVWVGHLDMGFFTEQMERIRRAGLEERFVFTGRVDDPREYYVAADVYALTSREDPFPSVVLEALDAEIPVVAFAGSSGTEELLNRNCGILVSAFDTDEMSAVVSNLLSNPARGKKLGHTGNAIVRWEFSFSQYLQDLLSFCGEPLPKVSVIVPNYNYARYLGQRFASITGQTVKPYELIVLDDASTDDSAEVIEDFLAGCDIANCFIRRDENSGSVVGQWRKGVEIARGDYVWVAEADDFADAGFLEEVLRAFRNPDVVISYCQSRQIDENGKVLSEHYLDYVADIDRDRWKKPYVASGIEEIKKALFLKNTIPNVSAVVFRREALQRVLTEHLDEIASFRHAGDWVTYLRLLEDGSVAFSPRSLNSHRRHSESVTISHSTMRHLQEIVRVQCDVIRRFRLDSKAMQATESYSQTLFHQFDLSTEKHRHFRDHPQLRSAFQDLTID